jgi:hypothetical protein
MGWWDASIMGGDGPLDTEHDFQERFGDRTPTADEGLDFMNSFGEYRDEIDKQVTAFLIIKAGAPMHDEVRRLALEGIAEEDTSEWGDPQERQAVLTEFAKIVKAYPAEGGVIDLPDQPGLLQKIMGLKT